MSRTSRTSALGVLLVVFAAGLVAAQDLRLRPTAAVYVDAEGAGISSPEGVAVRGTSLVVADAGNRRLLLYTVDGDQVTPGTEIRVAQIRYPTRVQVDSKGVILVLDGRSHRIARVDRAGEFQGYVEIPPSGEKTEAVPRSFEIDGNDNLYILDAAGARIVVVGNDGQLQRQIEYGPEVRFLSDLTVTPSGVVFAVDSLAKRVFVARKGDPALTPLTGSMEEDMIFPTGITADGEGHLFITDKHGGGIVIVGENGSFQGRQSAAGWKEGLLRYPSGLCFGNGRLFVSDRANNRVQIFTIVQ